MCRKLAATSLDGLKELGPQAINVRLLTESHFDTSSPFDYWLCLRSTVNLNKILRVIIIISRFGLVALFLFTAGAKLAIIKTFAGNVAELLSASHLNYARWMWPAALAKIARYRNRR